MWLKFDDEFWKLAKNRNVYNQYVIKSWEIFLKLISWDEQKLNKSHNKIEDKANTVSVYLKKKKRGKLKNLFGRG